VFHGCSFSPSAFWNRGGRAHIINWRCFCGLQQQFFFDYRWNRTSNGAFGNPN
jgi:hypothetical protein